MPDMPVSFGAELAPVLAAIAAAAPAHDREGSFPFDSLARLHEAGLLGVTASPEDGGRAAGLAEVTRLVGAVGGACAATALTFAMQLIHVRDAARNSRWPERLRRLVCRAAVAEGALINVLRVEPDLGTPARGGLPATIARRTPTGWSLSGRKIYSTGAPALRFFLVFARTDEAAPRMGNFLVPADFSGIAIEATWDQLGLRASASDDVVLTDVEVPADHAVDLREPGQCAPDPMMAAWGALSIAALYTGVARAAQDWFGHFLRDRRPTNLGAALATLPRMQDAMGAIEARLMTNRRLIESAAASTDLGSPPSPAESGLIKTIACENAIAAVEQAVAVTGNNGLSRRNPLERHLRDVHCARIHTPQPDAAYAAAGRVALGL